MQAQSTYDPSGLPARFQSKIRIAESGCWVWTSEITRSGYGRYGVTVAPYVQKKRLAHRYAYEMLVGPIPAGLQLDHLCRVRHCVNPAHLEPVTPSENIRRGVFPPPPMHCPKGHPYDKQNTGYTKNGWRYCRACARTAARARYKPKQRPRKTHCIRGHEFTPENTRINADGSRCCRACHRLRAARARSVPS